MLNNKNKSINGNIEIKTCCYFCKYFLKNDIEQDCGYCFFDEKAEQTFSFCICSEFINNNLKEDI